jgi:hypothetical protein
MAGCGCKKKNVQTTMNPSPATITLNETTQSTTMDQQVQQLVQKIEEINNALESEEEGQ